MKHTLTQLAPLAVALMLAATPMAHAQTAKKKAPEAPAAAAAATQEKVVYHVNDSAVARLAMNNVNNHMNAAPDAKIVIVTHGKGIDFLLKGAEDANGNPYELGVQSLSAKGVEFRVCANTLKSRNLDATAVIEEAKVVPSGVAEIGKLQAKEGYVYLKP